MTLLSKIKRNKKDKKEKLSQSKASTTGAPSKHGQKSIERPAGSSGSSETNQDVSKPTLTNALKHSSELFIHSSSSRSFEEASEIAEQLLGIVKDVSEATGLLSPLKSASALMIRGIQASRNAHGNSTAWGDLCNDLTSHVSQMEKWQTQLKEKPDIGNKSCIEALNHYLRIAAEIIKGAGEYAAQKKVALGELKRAVTTQTEKDEISRHRQRATNAWQAFTAAMNMDIFQALGRIEKQIIESETFISPNFSSNPKTVYGIKLDLCEEGTMTEVLDVIQRWVADTETKKQIFWLNDVEGTGKSTIAATMAREWRGGILAGRFFFSPTDVTERTTDSFCLTVAEDIAVNQPLISSIIRQAIRSTPRDHFTFKQQFEKLLVEPLQKCPGDRPMCIVIDGIDNCDDQEEREQLLELLVQFLPSIPFLKIFLTSRPTQDINDILNETPLVTSGDLQLFDVKNPALDDISLYVEKRLGNGSKVFVEEVHRKMIVEQSGGLFLNAATVCRMLKNAKSFQRAAMLEALERSELPQFLEHKPDGLYPSVLKQANQPNSSNSSFNQESGDRHEL